MWWILFYNPCIISLFFFIRELRLLTSQVMIKICLLIATILLILWVFLRSILIYFSILFICFMWPFGYIDIIFLWLFIINSSNLHGNEHMYRKHRVVEISFVSYFRHLLEAPKFQRQLEYILFHEWEFMYLFSESITSKVSILSNFIFIWP